MITATVEIPAGAVVLLGPSTWKCAITTDEMPCFGLIGSGAKLVGMGTGDSGEGADPAQGAALGITNLECFKCSASTDMVRVAIPVSGRTSLSSAIVDGPEVGGLWINMGNSGRDVLHIVSSHFGYYHDVMGYNFLGNGLHLEGAAPSDERTCGLDCYPESYNNSLDRIQMQAASANAQGANCYVDATHGEIGWNFMRNMRCSGNIFSGGGGYGMLVEAGTKSENESVDNLSVDDSYLANPSASGPAGGWALKMKAPGNFLTHRSGMIFNVTIRNTLFERMFPAYRGTPAGCTDGSDRASGTGCGDIMFENVSLNAGNWDKQFDYAAMGWGFSDIGGDALRDHPILRVAGSLFGAHAQAFRIDPTLSPDANDQELYGGIFVPRIERAGHTGTVVKVLDLDLGDATATGEGGVADAYALYINGNGAWAAGTWGIYQTGRAVEHFEGRIDALGGMNIADGIGNAAPQVGSTGFQHRRLASCTTAGTVGSTCATPVTWSSSFADTNYTASCTVDGLVGAPYILNTSKKTSSSILVTIASHAEGPSRGTINCIAVHD